MSVTRREVLAGGLAAPLLAAGCRGDVRWSRRAYRKPASSRVAVLQAAEYGGRLVDVILSGLRLIGVAAWGKTVVLKPNLVEFDPAGAINTHPAVIAGAVEAFRRLGAREVVVAEGPGHRRDNEYLLTASGLHDVLRVLDARYVDLNRDVPARLELASRFTSLGHLYLPETVLKADLFVSMPKLKTHHWAGVTLSMKNLFGIVPSAIYGWPKNPLHWAGIDQSILDINATLPAPQLTIVDGIVGMEGNGPIQGTARRAGVLLFGDDPVAVDATATRIMGLEPSKVRYLAEADRFLGNVPDDRIEQIGEPLERVAQRFEVIDSFKHLRADADGSV